MRNRKLAEYFFGIDERRSRFDIARSLNYAISLAAVVGWASVAPSGEIAQYALSGLMFVGVMQTILAVMGASNLSSLLVSLATFAFFGVYKPGQLAALSAFLAIMALAQVYFVFKGKLTGLAVAVSVGLLAAGEGHFAGLALCLFALLLVGRVAWHAVFERMSKKIWLKFSAKAFAMIFLACGIVVVLGSSYVFPWASAGHLFWPEVSWLVWSAWAVLVLRGLWAIMLLKTQRSPEGRGLRLYYVFLGIAVIIAAMALRSHGVEIFLPSVMLWFYSVGLLEYSPEVMTVVVVGVLLLASAGIDRSLYRASKPVIGDGQKG